MQGHLQGSQCHAQILLTILWHEKRHQSDLHEWLLGLHLQLHVFDHWMFIHFIYILQFTDTCSFYWFITKKQPAWLTLETLYIPQYDLSFHTQWILSMRLRTYQSTLMNIYDCVHDCLSKSLLYIYRTVCKCLQQYIYCGSLFVTKHRVVSMRDLHVQ